MGSHQPLSPKLTRRGFLAAGAALFGAAAGGAWKRWGPLFGPSGHDITGSIIGASHNIGHRLRGGGFPAITSQEKTAVAVVGGGVSGLSAGWKLLRSGLTDFRVLDLEAEPGGNARSGANDVSAYPWGAHYVPFPGREATAVHELFRELKIEVGTDERGKPRYDDRFVCFAPTERIFLHGRWQDGLFPRAGAMPGELEQFQAFNAKMAYFRHLRDSEGRRAFAIPMELSSRRADLTALDGISMAEYLRRNGWDSPRLRWYVEYACRDDFGSLLEDTSAWAGIHYFAARGEGDDDQELTWPEGNGFIVRKLAAAVSGQLRTSSLVFNVEPHADGVWVDYLDVKTGLASRITAKAVIICLPQFIARHVVAPLRANPNGTARFAYTPWMVANLTVDTPPPGKGAPPAWDNVLFASDSLGYVDATHQSLSQDRRAVVWTYYRPFPAGRPEEQRRRMLATSWDDWKTLILKDLSRAHPKLEEHVRNIDVMLWGHAMIKPQVGFVWGPARRTAARPAGRIFFGHSDLSPFSLFEEAQYRGIAAAQQAMQSLGKPFKNSI